MILQENFALLELFNENILHRDTEISDGYERMNRRCINLQNERNGRNVRNLESYLGDLSIKR